MRWRAFDPLRADVLGPGIAPLVSDPEVTDILIGPDGAWVDRGRGLVAIGGVGGEQEVRRMAIRLAAACGRRLDDAVPIVDGTLPDGTRLHAVLPPVAGAGTEISLRVFRPAAFTLAEMEASGAVAPAMARVLEVLVGRRASCLIAGGTGAGKTTLLAALLGEVPHDQRIVCIEEVQELRPDHPHVVHLQERQGNVQGAGAVPLPELVRAALRMRPDRLVLGECRGPEVREVLTALNTGHDGGWATLHANALADVPARLAALGALAGMDAAAVRMQAVAAIDAVVHVRREPTGRVVGAVGVLGVEGGDLVCRGALERRGGRVVGTGPAWPGLAARWGIDEAVASGRDEVG